jgi:hypothetical protein
LLIKQELSKENKHGKENNKSGIENNNKEDNNKENCRAQGQFKGRGAGQGNVDYRLHRHSVFSPDPDGRLQKIAVCEVSHEPGGGVVYKLDRVVVLVVYTRLHFQRVVFGALIFHREFCGLGDFYRASHPRHNQRSERKDETAAGNREVHDYQVNGRHRI